MFIKKQTCMQRWNEGKNPVKHDENQAIERNAGCAQQFVTNHLFSRSISLFHLHFDQSRTNVEERAQSLEFVLRERACPSLYWN